ncbi:MAG: monovalent cation/H+ antiporter complex subunit F [Wenzhouxiangellaceae bacterium]|nr:monovalent cation/H+ antiporter complex subunit F [Wenzhouxiangellaceae bacterium]
MNLLLWTAVFVLLANALACLRRVVAGPTLADRILGVNVIATHTVLVIALLARLTGHGFWLDIAIVYALLGFTLTLVAGRLVESGRLAFREPRR